jgi:hypothetical protein
MKTKDRKKRGFTAFEAWDSSMVPEPASYRPDYMDLAMIPDPKPAKRVATPIAVVRRPAQSACLDRSKPAQRMA